jgi:hypothetical protein
MTITPRACYVVGITLVTLGLVASNVEAQSATKGLTVPVKGGFTDATGNPGSFAGSLLIQKFVKIEAGINAVGTISGVLTDSTGVARTVVTHASLPLDLEASGVGGASALASGASALASDVTINQLACEILHLELGPLDLDLLGLVVHLDQVVLDLSAQPGPGNLLGNLLCAIVGLLDGGGALQQITLLLNQVLGLLG